MRPTIDTLYGTKIFVSTEAVRRWKEKRLRQTVTTWRGLQERLWNIVTVDCQEPCAYRMGNQIVMHPSLYHRLKNSPDLRNLYP